MIRINQIKLNIDHSDNALFSEILRQLKTEKSKIVRYEISKLSIDARKKDNVKYIYSIDVETTEDKKILSKAKNKNAMIINPVKYNFEPTGTEKLNSRPVIIGSGPAGLFCGYMLAKYGYKPIIIERGADVDKRTEIVENFFKGEDLNPNTNVQFGEGGAGTFSDGKLNTMVKDKFGRNRLVLEKFVEYGADKNILYTNKPHIGTDVLSKVVKNMRNAAIAMGAEFRFETKFEDFTEVSGKLKSINIVSENSSENETELPTDILVLAIGHSSRDTYRMLLDKGVNIIPKPFAIGVRLEHPRKQIDESQYGAFADKLPAAAYKLATNLPNGRGVYTFCMCPGGYVVNSSSEPGRIAVNGMSYSKRDGENSNTAMIVTVTPEDFGSDSPLAGIEFQRKLEEKAFKEGKGKVPVQLYADFKNNKKTEKLGNVTPMIKGSYEFANLRNVLPEFINDSLISGIDFFGTKIQDYNRDDAILSGVETRTSAPVTIVRNEELLSNISGIYPCGEGAGYAGGITSAAMDGIKVFEIIASKYAPISV